ncbi:peptidase [Methylophaga frappieri]|uniref:Peptidase n=1 Tax=Methylophaga frappieri (strain ATCC BAA-2434 / DSM 25690 / JAM7) TaxID=754477 RepID=I1YFT5_METFJ|nr:pitrilysin family protein [Methylophaga frappieri]AFJ01778.1 peptidase [Methylophaga frappieri]
MQHLKKIGFLLLILPLVATAQVSEFELDNGLKLLVKPDNRAPVVVSQVWYKVGSSYEYNGITGISHILEHMMFNGTKNLKPGEFSQIIADNGGSQNAFTGRDYTAYFQTLSADRLEVSFKLEADRMRNLQIDEEALLKERDVVAEERRMRTDDNPQGMLREAFNATAFMNSPYHHPVIGWMQDIQHYQKADLEDWYQQWYAPNNAIVVVVGDVEPNAVHALAKQYFGPLQPETVIPPKPQIEVEQRGKRDIQMQLPATLPSLMMGWKVPVVTTAETAWEPYALDVLAGILSGSSSSRFQRQLVREQQVAAGISAYNSSFSRLDDLFVIGGTPAQGKSVDALQKAIMAQLDEIKANPVSDVELQRVKTQVVADEVYEKDSVFYQAMQLGMLETIGLDWQVGEDYVDHIQAVTAAQVQQVAQRYFNDVRLTVAELVPLATKSNSVEENQAAGETHDH